MVDEKTVEKLRTLDVFPDTEKNPNSVRENAEIFEKCTTLDEIEKEAAKQRLGVGSRQFLYFHLGELLKKDTEYRARFLEEAKERFGGLGIQPEHIEEYFQSGTADPIYKFSLAHGEHYAKEVRKPFYDKANQFTLEKMRAWLGFS